LSLVSSFSSDLPLPILGQIVAVFGRQYLVEFTSGEILSCVMRGKKGGAVCGDQVKIADVS
jgi:ribosome biogenesis GTPase